MKTKKNIEKEIADLVKFCSNKINLPPAIKRAKKRISILRKFCTVFDFNNLNEKNLLKQLDEAEIKLKILNDRFNVWRQHTPDSPEDTKKAKQQYTSLMSIGKIKEQIANLKYILERS